jgi:23S rRNA (adenine2503-C2)-methyltransferase
MNHTSETRDERPQSLTCLTLDEFEDCVTSEGQPTYRAGQVFQWVYGHRAADYDDMTNLPKSLREQLRQEMPVFSTTVALEQVSADGTIKLLIRLHDGETVETVMIPEDGRRTVCLSTQVGCGVGCRFCASGLSGLRRNLSVGEIIEQVLHVRRAMARDDRVSNVVFMGMGEPLANYASLSKAITILNAKWGCDIGKRHITVSTVGLLSQAKRLARDHPQVTLAISLHAPNDEIRRQIVPTNDRMTVQDLIAAATEYFDMTGRKPTFEYCLIGGLNCRPEHAQELAARLQGLTCYVNLIPINAVPGIPFGPPSGDEVQEFAEMLRGAGVEVAVRRQRGADIDASCGQLRLKQGASQSAAIPRDTAHSPKS